MATTQKQRRNGTKRPGRKGKLNTGYRWRDKDPIIDTLMARFRESDLSYGRAAWSAGLSETTVRKWDSGETRSPQYRSVVRFMSALGMEFGVYQRGEVDALHRCPSTEYVDAEVVRWQKSHKDRQPAAVPAAKPLAKGQTKGQTKGAKS